MSLLTTFVYVDAKFSVFFAQAHIHTQHSMTAKDDINVFQLIYITSSCI